MATLKDKLGNWLGRMRQNESPVKVDVQRNDADEPGKKDVSVAQLKQGYSEVVETMQSVRKHLETQSERSERMMRMFEGMPEILKSIPETNRAQVRLLEAIHANLDRQNETSSELSGAIHGLTKAADTQQSTMSQIQDHLAAEDEARRELMSGVDSLNITLDGVKESNESARATLSSISDQAAMREQRIVELFERSRKTQTMMTIVAWVLALAALSVAFYVAVQATRMQSTPTTVMLGTPPITAGVTALPETADTGVTPTDAATDEVPTDVKPDVEPDVEAAATSAQDAEVNWTTSTDLMSAEEGTADTSTADTSAANTSAADTVDESQEPAEATQEPAAPDEQTQEAPAESVEP